jgi:hypothetical protein
MEYWNVGILGSNRGAVYFGFAFFSKAFIPFFHHANIPAGTEFLTCLSQLLATLVAEFGLW